MNLLDLAVKISCKDEASSQISGIANGITGTMGKAAGIVSAVMGSAAVAGTIAIGKSALEAYAKYEQMVGGVDKLFGEASGKLQGYAAQAYKTTGMSANQYMEQATSFSASLISSLGGDVQQAADLADVAMRSMSDNVNVFGSNMEDVQNAYQGFAKQNYTMLDNLKLGYGGTKEEMERLVKDASNLTDVQEQLGLTVDGNSLSFANIVKAIQVMQTEMGIAGTTANEAASTIEGSVTMMKAAWENWLTGLGDSDADMTELTNELVDSVITAAGNVIPRIATIADTAVKTIAQRFPEVVDAVKQWISDKIPEEFRGTFENVTSTVSGKIEEVKGYFSDLWNKLSENSTLSELAETFRTLAEKVGDVAGKFGEFIAALVPPPEDVVSGIEDIRDALQWISDNFDGIMTALVGLGAAWATFTIVSSVAAGVAAFKAALDGATASASIFNIVLNANPLVLVATLIIGVAAALAYFFTQTEQGRQIWSDFTNFLSTTIENIKAWFADMAQKIQTKFQEVSDFVSQIPGKIQGFFQGLPGWFSQRFEEVKSGITGKLQEAANFVGQIPGRIQGFFQGLPGWFSQVFQNVKSGIQSKFDEVVGFVSGIPGRITSALGNLGSLLWNAGSSIIGGLLNGLKSKWDEVTGWFSSITSQIPQLKGPAPVDAKLLVGNGSLIMGGLLKGMESGWDDVESFLSSRTREIGVGFDVPTTTRASGIGGTSEIVSEIRSLKSDLGRIIRKNAPTMTGRDFRRAVQAV